MLGVWVGVLIGFAPHGMHFNPAAALDTANVVYMVQDQAWRAAEGFCSEDCGIPDVD